VHHSKSNVYQTLVLAAFTPRPWILVAIGDAPSGERSIDTFVQLVSLHFSGLIAIEDHRKHRFPGFKNRGSAMNERQPIPLYGRKNRHSPADADLMVIAERELGAFIRAVTELFGPEQARLAAEEWIDELESMDALPGPTRRDWGSVTIAASAQLARRLNTEVDRPRPRVASTDTKVSPIPSSNCFDPRGLA
jgi:hypothetical protein